MKFIHKVGDYNRHAKFDFWILPLFLLCRYAGFSKRIEVGVSIYKLGGELKVGGASGEEPESLVGGGGVPPPENVEILDCRRCILRPY